MVELKVEKADLIHWLTRKLLPLIEPKDIVSFAKKGNDITVMTGGKKLTTQELESLRGEAKFLEQTRLWKIINAYFTDLAKKKIYLESKDSTDILFGKTVLYVLDVQKTILDNIKKSQ